MKIKTLDNNSYEEYMHETELQPEEVELLQKAREASGTSYSPYSNFQVGAAIRLDDGQIILGSNQENAAYPSGLCAERVAIFNVGSNYSDKKIVQMAVAARRKNEEIFLPVTPCGSCRQVILEYENRQQSPIEFIMRSGPSSWIKTKSCRILLPFSFDKSSL